MAIKETGGHTNGESKGTNGTTDPVSSYSIPQETQKVFQDGILNNPLIGHDLPTNFEECAKTIRFEGSRLPSIPINWRFAESISALKGFEAAMLNVLLTQKYNVPPQEAVINTDHAQLFFMSILLNTIDPAGEKINIFSPDPQSREKYNTYFKDYDLHNNNGLYRANATNIYRCADGKYFHLHGSMNPEPTQDSLGLPHQMDVSLDSPWDPYMEKISNIKSDDLQTLANDTYKQAGTICHTVDSFAASKHGKANAHVGLYELASHPNASQPASWWPSIQQTSPARPLAGLKVLDLTRVIAAPALTRGLAELGASVMRITASHITDMSTLHADLNWGKWNAHLDFRKPQDRETLTELIMQSDVVVQAYRPGVLDKYGFSVADMLRLTSQRSRGLIVVRENCYGWHGPWSYRSGWQQISDACCGVSMEYGRAMGLDEPVTPVFPNSDFCTGTSGVVGVLQALIKRGTEGGSWGVDVALNYYSTWLTSSVLTYPPPIFQHVSSLHEHPQFRHFHNMGHTLPRMLNMLRTHASSTLFQPSFFEIRHSGAIGKDVHCVKPIIQFPGGMVRLGFNVGTRGNGVDQARWPEDLMVEVVR